MDLEPLDELILGVLGWKRDRQTGQVVVHPALSFDELFAESSGNLSRDELQLRVNSLCERHYLSIDEKGNYMLGVEAVKLGRW